MSLKIFFLGMKRLRSGAAKPMALECHPPIFSEYQP